MTNLLIASFKQEAEAIEASQKLNELESIGDITIYEMVVITKNADGEAVVLQADTNEGVRTLSGMAIGTLIGCPTYPLWSGLAGRWLLVRGAVGVDERALVTQ